MRRPASNSCLLLPKPSEEELDDGLTTNVSSPLSVTLIHQTTLPTYSSERFFLLSELHVHAQSIRFLSQSSFADGDEDQSTQATEDETVEDNNDTLTPLTNEALPTTDTDASNPDISTSTKQLPPFVILYILWKPEITTNPETFTELYILDALLRIDEERNRMPPSHTDDDASIRNGAAKEIYLVIDRVLPAATGMTLEDETNTRSDDCTEEEEEEDSSLALEYAWIKYLAAHPVLRTRLQGVVVGQSNHVRAAPGLELCTHAISSVGTAERRRWSGSPLSHHYDSTKSWMGVVTRSSEDLLGLQEEGVTDAADGVRQRIVTGEWLGQGDIYMFATRAHALWKQQHGISNVGGEEMPFGYFGEKRSVPRRKSRAPIATLHSLYNPQRRRRGMGGIEIPDSVYEVMGCIFIGLYILFHYGRREDDVLVIRLFRPVLLGFLSLIQTWNTVIQSARGW
jgi:hypothetical protein